MRTVLSTCMHACMLCKILVYPECAAPICKVSNIASKKGNMRHLTI